MSQFFSHRSSSSNALSHRSSSSRALSKQLVPIKATTTSTNAVTPFRRIPLNIYDTCVKVPDIPFTTYDIFVFNSKMENKLKQSNIPYFSFTLINKMINGEVVNTVQLLLPNGDIQKLNTKEVQEIQEMVNQVNQEFPGFMYFCSLDSFPYPSSWLETIFPSLEFYRTPPPPYENEEIYVPKIVDQGNIYLDLSGSEQSYMEDAKELFYQLQNKLAELYPNSSEVEEDLGLPPNPSDWYNKYILDMNFEPSFDFYTSLIGSKFIQSLKQFLNAFDVMIVMKDNQYEFIPIDINQKPILSKINIHEMYGKMYVTSSPYGLLALSKLFTSITPILDEYSGKIGLFIPMMENGYLTELTMWQKLKDNFEMTYDVYFSPNEEMKSIVKEENLKYEEVELILDDIHTFSYLFVEKHS